MNKIVVKMTNKDKIKKAIEESIEEIKIVDDDIIMETVGNNGWDFRC